MRDNGFANTAECNGILIDHFLKKIFEWRITTPNSIAMGTTIVTITVKHPKTLTVHLHLA
jgi:hypothetical protein